MIESPFISNYDIWGLEDGAVSVVIPENMAMEWYDGDDPFWFEIDKLFNMVVGSAEERIVIRSIPGKTAHLIEDIGVVTIIEIAEGQVKRCTPVPIRALDKKRVAA